MEGFFNASPEVTVDDLTTAYPVSQWNSTLSIEDPYNTTADNTTIQELPNTPTLSQLFMGTYFGIRCLWSVLAVMGNVFTIYLVARFELLHTNTNILLCSLGVADLLGALLTPLLIFHQTHQNSPYYVPTCLIEKMLNLMSTGGNMFSILFISIDRYIYIGFPLRYHTLVRRTRVFVLLSITWFYFLFIIPPLVFFNNHLKVGMTCKYGLFLRASLYKYYLTPQFFIMILMTIGFYLAIARIAHKQSRAVAALNQPYQSIAASTNRKSWRIIKMLGTVLGVYLLSLIPQYLMTVILQSYGTSLTLLRLESVTVLIYWANSWVNPFIYVWKLKDFKSVFGKLWRGSEDIAESNNEA